MLGKVLEHTLYWNWAFCLTWALISGPQAFYPMLNDQVTQICHL
jgi:hypothetical protein